MHAYVATPEMRRRFREIRSEVDEVAEYHSSRPVEVAVFDNKNTVPRRYMGGSVEPLIILDKDSIFWRDVDTVCRSLEPDGSYWCDGAYEREPVRIADEMVKSGITYIRPSHVRKAQRRLNKQETLTHE